MFSWLQGDRFKSHDAISNRRLLWHGTNVAVVAAILKSGLRIMPHSGGRVGKGIYFASECSKSASYGECVSSFILLYVHVSLVSFSGAILLLFICWYHTFFAAGS